MPKSKKEEKASLRKLKSLEVDKLKGKLVEVRRIGASPIFIEVTKKDTIEGALKKADVPTTDDEIKVEAIVEGSNQWKEVKMKDKASKYSRIVVTTKVSGA